MHLSHLVLFGKDGFHVTGYFQEAEGIERGNPVRYAGVEVGRVDDISVEKGEAVLSLRFYEGTEVPKDALFSIQTSGVMGGMYVRVSGESWRMAYWKMECPFMDRQLRDLSRR